MNLKQTIRRILREDKLYITPQELVKNLPQELKELLFKQWGAKQNPEWHPEGNTLKHILVVIRRAYHHYPDDPNMIMAALFHDLGKIDTYKINPKTGQPTAYGHEDKSTAYVEQFREWIESFEGTDVDEIKYLVKNHMKVKPSTWDQMKDKKKEPIKSHPAFDKLMGFTDKLDGGGIDLKETIRRILREELSVKVRRRVPLDEMETEFLESFETAYRILKNKKVSQKDFLDKLIYTTATVMMDGIHWRLFSSFPKDDNSWYDEIQSELENHYRDRIIQMYNEKHRGINESILTEASKVKTLVDKVGLTQGNAVELDRLCGSLSIWMANKLINHQQGINTSWNRTNQTGLETLNDRGVDRFRSLITSIMDWIRIGLNGNLGDNKNLTFSDLVFKSQEWHQSLNIGDGDINYVEKNPIVLDFRDENGNGFYWVDLETSNSPEECDRMGHCGRSSFGNLYSLREFKPLNDKYKVNKSHLTASIGSDGILYQLKGPKNSKPKEELHGYITPLFYVLGGGGEEEDYLIQGFGSEYASQKDFKISDLSDEVIKDLYRNRPELFNTRGLQRKLAELGYIELPEINYNIKVNIGVDEVGSYVDGDWVISRRKVKRTTPGGIEYEQTIERTLFEDILTGETWDLYEPGEVDWRGIVDYYMDDENAKYIRDILLKVASKTEDFNQEDFDEESLENLIEEYDDEYEIRNAIRNAGENIERSEYYDYLYKELKSSLEEYGSVEKMDDTGVTLNVNVKPYLEEHDEDIIDEILDECNDDYNCVFRYLVREEMIIDRPKFETSDYWSPDYKDKEELNSMINDYLSDAERAYSK